MITWPQIGTLIAIWYVGIMTLNEKRIFNDKIIRIQHIDDNGEQDVFFFPSERQNEDSLFLVLTKKIEKKVIQLAITD